MTTSTTSATEAVTDVLLDRYGQTYANEAGFTVKDTPAPLFRLLVLSTLLSARIGADIAVAAARRLADEGWTTPDKLAATSWEERVHALNDSGYARYDESTSRMLGESVELLLDRWDGDLRKLREDADGDPDAIRTRLKQFKGIGDVGVDIFLREVQGVWDELHPFVDDRTLDSARALDLGDDAAALAKRCDREDFPRLVSALVRVGLAEAHDEIRDAAT